MTSAVVDRLDLDALVARVDVNRVADRVDVDRVVLRVDVDAVIARVDLVVLTRDVLQAIDLGQMVRDTSGGAAEGTVAALRVRSVRADRVVNHFADRLLHRPGADPQGTDGPGPTP
ncbi:hypothetical protein [Streptomyces sp. TLI_146]|uniref:hypothetical protein n=1 Tax=Streptomyces sp. TLI_146 TaxID=1938858 RepID=UPI00117D9D21|nr:hypothetical protein [Streptomyces sp. TLI_146]